MLDNNIRMLCLVIKIDLVYEDEAGSLTPFFDSLTDSPLMQSVSLRGLLREGTSSQSAPYIMSGPQGTFFSGIRAGNGYLYLGPMCTEALNASKRKQLFCSYDFECDSSRPIRVFTLPEIRNVILLTNSMLQNTNLENEELLYLNRVISGNESRLRREQTQFILREEEENDEASYRHSYHEEQLLMQAVREGRTQDALRIAESMDTDVGRLSNRELGHWRNLAIVGITLCSRAAIEGGLFPESAYRISGYYIQKCDAAQDAAHLLHYRNRAIEELTGRVLETSSRTHASNHVENCKDYIRKHYREKIYLEDVADALGLSPSYLSRLFRRETGACLNDFINEERVYRAENLLKYSDCLSSRLQSTCISRVRAILERFLRSFAA